MHLNIPTEEDWGDWSINLDVMYAHKIFAGKTNADIQKEFSHAVIERTDELRWMPRRPFQYYMLGFRDFVIARNFSFSGASDAATCFLGLVEQKLTEQPDYILPIMEDIIPSIRYISENQAKYEADIDIYGDFQEIRRNIENLYQELKAR